MAHSLTVCHSRNNRKVCAEEQDLAALDKRVAEMVESFKAIGPTCVDAITPMLCSMYFPLVHEQHGNDVHQVCFNQCEEVFRTCGFEDTASKQMCRQASTNPLSNIQRPHETDDECLDQLNLGAKGRCEQVHDLQHCPHMNGKNVFVHSGLFKNAKHADDYVGAALKQKKQHSLSKGCRKGLNTMYCAVYLPECDSSAADDQPLKMCKPTCKNQLRACDPDFASICGKKHHAFAESYVERSKHVPCGYDMEQSSFSREASAQQKEPYTSTSHQHSPKEKVQVSTSSTGKSTTKKHHSHSGSSSSGDSNAFVRYMTAHNGLLSIMTAVAFVAVMAMIAAGVVLFRLRASAPASDSYGKFKDRDTA